MNNMMSVEYLREVLEHEHGQAEFWLDVYVPSHLTKMLYNGQDIHMDNIKMERHDAHSTLRFIL